MTADPHPKGPTPLAVIKGWRSPEPNARRLARNLRQLTHHDERSCRVFSYNSRRGIPAIATDVAARIQNAWPNHTTIDIAAVSMGGLIARHIAANPNQHKLTVRTLYTLATPHRGAQLARIFHFLDASTAQMRPGSPFLEQLDHALTRPQTRPTRLITLSRTRDWWVGTANTKLPEHLAKNLPDHEAHTVHAPPHTLAHLLVARDKHIPQLIARDLERQTPTTAPHHTPAILTP